MGMNWNIGWRCAPLALAAALAAATLAVHAEPPGGRESIGRMKLEARQRQPAPPRDGRERPPRPADPPRLRAPRERPAPDVHRPPRPREDGRPPHWKPDDRRPSGARPPQRWHDDRRWDPPKPRPPVHRHHPPRYRPGHHVHTLGPSAFVSLHFGQRYWFDNGYWYQPASTGYVVVQPPPGVYVQALPGSYTLVRVGPHVYYEVNGIYYAPVAGGGYQVVEVPEDEAVAAYYEPPMVYPARGQTPEQQGNDEYECHAWAVDRAGFDPTLAPLGQGPEGDEILRGNYRRALVACLEGRGYTVK